ncbi:MAG: DUF3416 domain-containing protein, partial [Nitrospira sp.]|nr:DUF3416 domain-containing protein [Nitrospira sp.]
MVCIPSPGTGHHMPADYGPSPSHRRTTHEGVLMPNMPKTLQTLIIEHVEPELDGGRYPVKRIVGENLDVTADVFKEGHDTIGAVLRY